MITSLIPLILLMFAVIAVVVCSKEFKMLAVIELDDSGHSWEPDAPAI